MSTFKDLDNLLQKFVDDGLPGCGMVIAKKGEILYENYFGYADIENNIPITKDTVFRQASLTKIALYTTLMLCYEKGMYLMTDPMYEYMPEWKDTKKAIYNPDGSVSIVPVEHPITIKDIFNMTVGMPYEAFVNGNYPGMHPTALAMSRALQPLRDKGRYTLREQIKAMSEVPLSFEPGTRHQYGFASELAAGMLEALFDKPAELVIKEMLFEPLGMDSSANFLTDDLAKRLVKNYHMNKGKKLGDEGAYSAVTVDRVSNMEGPLGTCSGFQRVLTTCRDYTKLMQMLANGGMHEGQPFMGRHTIDLIRENCLTPTQIKEDFDNNYLAGYGYGYGMRTLMDKYAGHHNGSLGQFGWTGGTGTWAEADPSEGTSIVYMHNIQPNFEEYHHLRMRAVAYGCLD